MKSYISCSRRKFFFAILLLLCTFLALLGQALFKAKLEAHLVDAVYKHDAQGVRYWLRLGADANSSSVPASYMMFRLRTQMKNRRPLRVSSDPLLLVAVCQYDQEIARLLLEGGANVNCRDQKGETPLMALADISPSLEDATPEEIARTQSLCRLLLARGADVNATTKYGTTALMYASGNNCIPIMRLLLTAGAQVDAEQGGIGGTALLIATARECPAAIKLLLAHGARKDARDSEGKTALDVAKSRQNEELLKLLTH